VSKRVLVTGAAGFIGSHAVAALLARGDSVVGIDNLNDYYAPARKRANLAAVAAGAGGERFTFHEADVRDRAAVAALVGRSRFDGVVHLAAMAGVRASVEDPALYYDVNVGGTLNLLDALAGRLPGTRRPDAGLSFVFASTSSVYGATPRIPFEESDPCDRPLSPYSASKRSVEMLGHTYHHLHGLSFTALRFFTVYGPRNRPDMMAYKVMDSIFSGRDVPLFNGGQMHRDWTFVADVVAGILAAVDRPLGYEVLNLGRGEPILLADFVGLIEELTGRRARLVPAPAPDSDVPYTYASIDKARSLLGYEPRVSAREGVGLFWDWYRRAVLDAEQT
jgi:UDP-glucuronate 4-epimerase